MLHARLVGPLALEVDGVLRGPLSDPARDGTHAGLRGPGSGRFLVEGEEIATPLVHELCTGAVHWAWRA